MVPNLARSITPNGRLKQSLGTIRMHFVLFLATCLALPVSAREPVKPTKAEQEEMQGEIERLSGEIRRLGRRQIWAGVERKYTQLIAIGGAAASDVHLMAAYSARERGDLLEVHGRLMRAAADAPSEAVVDWLYDLDHNFGRVELIADRKRTAQLTAAVIPLDPSRRKAVQAAVDTCSSTGRFNGLLPRGEYTFAGQGFKVEPGIGVRVEVSPRARRQGMVEPTIVYQELPQATAKESK